MNQHFEPMSIESALKNNLLPQPCCPKTYFSPNDNEMDEEFEEDCPACREAGYLERDYLDKLDIQCDELKKMHELNKSLEELTISNSSSESSNEIKVTEIMEPVGSMISNIFSSFMSSLIQPNFDTEETVPELDKTKKINRKINKVKKYKIRKYGIRKYKIRKYI
jgi:hypothetical protein